MLTRSYGIAVAVVAVTLLALFVRGITPLSAVVEPVFALSCPGYGWVAGARLQSAGLRVVLTVALSASLVVLVAQTLASTGGLTGPASTVILGVLALGGLAFEGLRKRSLK